MLAIPEQECAVCHRRCGARDATRAGGRASRVSQATCGSGGRQPLRAGYWCRRRRPTCGGGWRVSLFRGGARRSMEGTRWVAAYFRVARTCTPLHSQVSQTLPFARHWTNTLHLRLSDSLQSSRFMRSALCVAGAWYWMDNPLKQAKSYVPSVPPLRRNLRGRVFILSSLLGVSCAEPAAD